MAGGWKAGAVALVVLVSCCLVAPGSAGAKSSSRTDVEVFMRLEATPAETKAVGAFIRHSRSVRKYRFLTRADAYRVFAKRFVDQPDLVATTTVDQLPESFRISLEKGAKAKPLVNKLQQLPGVDEVKYFDQSDAFLKKMTERACKNAKKSTVDFEVFMKVGATDAQTAAVRAALRHSSEVDGVTFVSKHDALREMRELFANQPEATAGVTVDTFPTSFRVDLRKHADTKQLTRRLKRLPGVDSVNSTASLRAMCEVHAIGPISVP